MYKVKDMLKTVYKLLYTPDENVLSLLGKGSKLKGLVTGPTEIRIVTLIKRN